MTLMARLGTSRARAMELSHTELALAMGIIGLDVVARLAPHAPNFTPVAASALFAGAVLRVMGVVYAALALPALLGRWGRARGAIMLAPLALASSLIFFATTNFAVWAFSGMYTHDLAGLVHCYVAALPFLQNTIIGDMLWTTLLFGGWWTTRFVADLTPRTTTHPARPF